MTIGYLTNQYPAVSHTFIRREILALEARGVPVERCTIRRSTVPLVHPEDLAELAKTHCLLGGGAAALLGHTVATFLTRPVRFLGALGTALRLGRSAPRGRSRHLAYLAEACALLAFARRRGVHHVHAHFGTNSAAVAMLCRALGGPTFSVTVHGPDEFDRPLELSLREKAAAAEFVAAISQFGQSQLFRWCDARDWPKVKIVPCGVDASFSEEPPVPVTSDRRLLWIGRMAGDKGVPILVDACTRLAAEGVSFRLVLAGDGPLRAELEARVRSLGLAEKVTFAGWVGDAEIRREIEAARAIVSPSFAEGLPVVLMEALARGRPAVATRVAAIPELVVDGVTGWIVSPGSAEELADAMRRALDTPHERLLEMSRACRERALTRHDVRRSAEILAGLFPKAG